MTLHPTDKQPVTKAQRIFLDLRSKILGGELTPERHLTLRPIAETYGTGINAASEAVKALAAEGLVRLEGKAGARILARDLNRIRGDFILRMAIECETVRRVTDVADDMQLAALRRIADHVDALFEEGDSLQECRRLDVQFHDTLASFSGVPQLREALDPLLDRLVCLDQTSSRNEEIPGQKHMEVFEAIETRDPNQAVEAMRMHLEHSMHLSLAELQFG
ncbi:GntR family transcriptional regulator [Bremerella sp. JC770]|uniref:GntR family transcriptional regulator n=1 Tax=Bremerella sp. JC770 TaxID=3232137 RepID=UPI00345A5C63